MKKLLAILLSATMIFSLTACSGVSKGFEGMYDGGGGEILNKGDVVMDAMPEAGIDGDFAPGEIGGSDIGGTQKPNLSAGTLTAGEWRDAENIDFWTNLLNRNDWYQLMEDRNLYTNNIISVCVSNQEGYRYYNLTVELLDVQNSVLYTAVTDVFGNAYLLYNLNNEKNVPTAVRVDGEIYTLNEQKSMDIKLDKEIHGVKELDLMLMVDTTGSMSDELTYLQKELENVIQQVAQQNQILSIRVSVNFYRDETDEYVVRSFDFTSDINEAIAQLNAQKTDGGGDYPEAVHKALDNIIQGHQWRNDAVKLCFFVLDAPPHSESEIKGINLQMQTSIANMSKQGIRIIPIVSSGVNTETEFLLRSWALMTGGTYTFLTDHSGVGNSHLEPTIGEYKVEKLNDMMVRIINEYCGLNSDITNQ